MLFFLHIPRTAGRTFHSCFLKQAFPPSRRCAKSYDVLRLDKSITGCGLLSSHDDYSIIDNLPEDSALFTQLRDPVDRVLSAYEFALEVAARSAVLKDAAPPKPLDPDKTSTRNVWPWSFLVPFMENDITARQATAREVEGMEGQGVDPYYNSVTMPLQTFLENPSVENVLFNGATFQVLGLTDYSQWKGVAELRACVPHSPEAKEVLVKLALERLDKFVHVGIFERLEDSVASLADTLGIDLESSSWSGRSLNRLDLQDKSPESIANKTRHLEALEQKLMQDLSAATSEYDPKDKALPDKETRQDLRLQKSLATVQQDLGLIREFSEGKAFEWQDSWDKAYENFYPLWRAYHFCVDNARSRNAKRRAHSFQRLDMGEKKIRFSTKEREAMKQRNPDLVGLLRQKNDMDVALYEKGQQLLDAALKRQQESGRFKPLPPANMANLAEISRFERAMQKPAANPEAQKTGEAQPSGEAQQSATPSRDEL